MTVHRQIPGLLAAFSAALFCACSTAPTQLFVTVDTDFEVPVELDRIDVSVRDESGEVQSAHPFEVVRAENDLSAGKYSLPISFAVVPREGRVSGRVTIDVEGHLGDGAVLLRRTARIAFVEQQSIPLRLFLAEVCQDVRCPEEQTCIDGACAPIDVQPQLQDAGTDATSDAIVGHDGGGDIDSSVTPTCEGDDMLCGAHCRDTQNDTLFCGNCETQCALGDVCNAGHCETVSDCRMSGMSCSGLTYCAPSSGVCTPGCDSSAQCTGTSEQCNTTSHACECTSDTHDCGGVCSANLSVNSCGTRCAPCPTDANGTAGCNGISCTLTCNSGSMWCSDHCALCPTDPGTTATGCGGTACVATSCASGFAVIAGRCMSVSTLAQQAYIKQSNTGAGDGFGYSLAISSDGNTLAVGAYGEDSADTGIDGEESDNSYADSGAVYVFRRSGSSWFQQAYIKSFNTDPLDLFGLSVALSDDGNVLAVGAPGEDSFEIGVGHDGSDNAFSASGAAYIFERSGGTWAQEYYLKASNTDNSDQFGYMLALSGDGATLAVGANLEDSQGRGINGSQTLDTAMDSGSVYVFTRGSVTWSQQAYVKASNSEAGDEFGITMALSTNGSTLVVGSSNEDSSASHIDGNQGDNSAADSGAVYVFARSGTTWAQQAYVKASNSGAGDLFGYTLALSGDGNTLAVGAVYEDSNTTGIGGDESNDGAMDGGAAYVFSRAGSTWTQQAYIKASNTDAGDIFARGITLSANGNVLAVGAPAEDGIGRGVGTDDSSDATMDSGAVYLFERTGSAWAQRDYIKASNTGAADNFGTTIALSADGHTLVVAAQSEDSSATGIGGDQADNGAINSGAVYVFTR